jgi:crossover junction endodeoxyribonuclease RuvC
MRVLGLDPGMARLGYGAVAWEGSEPRFIGAGVIRPQGEGAERLSFVFHELRRLVRELAPELAVVERAVFGPNPSSALALGEIRGVCLLACAEEGVPVVSLSPAELKRSVTGHGGAGKVEVKRMVRLLLGVGDGLSADEADALALALSAPAGMALSGRGRG